MIRRCAWCGRLLDKPIRNGDRQVTHGICAECRALFLANSDATKNPKDNGTGSKSK